MLDIKFIRENAELIQEAAKKKHVNFDVQILVAVDDKRKALSQALDEKRSKQNKVGEEVAKSEGEEKAKLIAELTPLKEEIGQLETELREVMAEWQKLMIQVPNIPDMSVPDGDDDSANIEVKAYGEIPKFDFEPKSHIELMENLDIADFETGSKVSGFRGYFLKNDGALLAFAVWQLTMDLFRKNHPEYSVMFVPAIVKRETLIGTGYLPQAEEEIYKTQDGDYLSGTAEVATMSYFADRVFNEKDLPKKILAFSPAFRREAGSHGKDVKGLYRVHEFMKFEQVILCEANHATSVTHHEELLSNAEELLQALKLPYHVVVNCGGDLGLGQVKKYDIETWMPSKNKYGETHSCSYFHDFQTRRLNIKYKAADGKQRFTHSLNNTAVATPRLLIQIVENNQQADGSIIIPEALRPYMGGKEKIVKNGS